MKSKRSPEENLGTNKSSTSENSSTYWRRHYDDPKNVSRGCHQTSVGRTIDGNPVPDSVWQKTISHIVEVVKVDQNSIVLELCCGNGMVIGPISQVAGKAYGVDFSEPLLNQLHSQFGKAVETRQIDVLELTWKPGTLDAIIIYFSIQHFDEQQTLHLIQRSLEWLRPGGRMLIGDIPDRAKKWKYIGGRANRLDYLQRMVSGQPKIGNWFDREFFVAAGEYFENRNTAHVKVLDQPQFLFNAQWRFDVLFTKANA